MSSNSSSPKPPPAQRGDDPLAQLAAALAQSNEAVSEDQYDFLSPGLTTTLRNAARLLKAIQPSTAHQHARLLRCVAMSVGVCTPRHDDWTVPLETAAREYLPDAFANLGTLCEQAAVGAAGTSSLSTELSEGLADAFVDAFTRLRDSALHFNGSAPTDEDPRTVESVGHIFSICCGGLALLRASSGASSPATTNAPPVHVAGTSAAIAPSTVPLMPPPPFVPLASSPAAAPPPPADAELTQHHSAALPAVVAGHSDFGADALTPQQHAELWRPCPQCREVIPRSRDGPNAKRHPNTELFRCPNRCGHIELAAEPMKAPAEVFEVLRRGVEFSPPNRKCSGCGRRMLKQASTGIKHKGRFKFECLVCRDYQWVA